MKGRPDPVALEGLASIHSPRTAGIYGAQASCLHIWNADTPACIYGTQAPLPAYMERRHPACITHELRSMEGEGYVQFRFIISPILTHFSSLSGPFRIEIPGIQTRAVPGDRTMRWTFNLISFLLILSMISGCGARLIILHDPLDAKAHNELGVTYLMEGQWKAAIRAFRRAHRKNPDWPVPLLNLGYLYSQLGQWDRARENYKKALKLARGACPDCWNNLAFADFRQEGPRPRQLRWIKIALIQSRHPRGEYYLTAAEIELGLNECTQARRSLQNATFYLDGPGWGAWARLWQSYQQHCGG